jgi:hypothetical protein
LGIPANREPRECRELRWFPLDELPATATRYCRVALKHIAAGDSFSVDDWEAQMETRPATRPEADLPAAKRLGTCSPVPAAMPGLRGGLIATPKAAPSSAFRVIPGY